MKVTQHLQDLASFMLADGLRLPVICPLNNDKFRNRKDPLCLTLVKQLVGRIVVCLSCCSASLFV